MRVVAAWVGSLAVPVAVFVLGVTLSAPAVAPAVYPVASSAAPAASPGATSAPVVATSAPTVAPSSTRAPSVDVYAQALASLDALPTRSDDAYPDYRRAAFGDNWIDADGDGCYTRNEILARDLTAIEYAPGDTCKVMRGVLDDAYTGARIDFQFGQDTSPLVQIDHVVPLAYAWRNGAHAWTDDARLQFANDPLELRAVDGPTNQSKSAKGPAEWMPPNESFRCEYSRGFVDVLATYSLTVEPADKAVLAAVLKSCE